MGSIWVLVVASGVATNNYKLGSTLGGGSTPSRGLLQVNFPGSYSRNFKEKQALLKLISGKKLIFIQWKETKHNHNTK